MPGSLLDAALVLRFGHLPLPPALIAVLDTSTWVLFVAGLLAWTGQRDRATIRAGLDGTLLAAALFLLAWWAGGSAVTAESNATLLRTIRSILPFALTCTSLGAIAYLGARSADRLKGPLGLSTTWAILA